MPKSVDGLIVVEEREAKSETHLNIYLEPSRFLTSKYGQTGAGVGLGQMKEVSSNGIGSAVGCTVWAGLAGGGGESVDGDKSTLRRSGVTQSCSQAPRTRTLTIKPFNGLAFFY